MAILLRSLAGLTFLFLALSQSLIVDARPVAPEDCDSRPFDRGRLWKVSDGKAPPSYILGTMHSKDPRILQLPGVVMQVFNNARSAVFETSLKDEEMANTRQFMLLAPEDSLRAKIGAQTFATLANIAARYRIPAAALDRLKIWAAAAVISQPPPNGNPNSAQFALLDKELEKSAYRSGKKVIALESNREQMAVFDNMSERAQIEYLKQSIQEYGKLDEEMETITEYYLAGRTGWIACNLESSLDHASRELNAVMTTRLIDQRNRHMVERMLPVLAHGNAFVGIGALHLPGLKGVLSLLEQRGYHIERKY